VTDPLTGYWNVHQAVDLAEIAADEARSKREAANSPPFGGAKLGTPAAQVLRQALRDGSLLAAALREDGELVTMKPADWRRPFARPEDRGAFIGHEYRDRFGHKAPPSHQPPPFVQPHFPGPDPFTGLTAVPLYGPPERNRDPFEEATKRRPVPLAGQGPQTPAASGHPLIAQADLARWMGEDEPPADPPMRPADWPKPTRALPNATEDQVFWFMAGYAVRALESGKPATRDEARDAVTGENIAGARLAEKVHAERLPPRLKNADRSKGSNRPK
jgi:hypothetical protein